MSALLSAVTALRSCGEIRREAIADIFGDDLCGACLGIAKAALEACTRIWANELASAGITVNAVAPGPTETDLYRERSPIGSERETRLLETIPLHRVAKPQEIAHAICALLDEDAGYITGQVIRADGGGSIAA